MAYVKQKQKNVAITSSYHIKISLRILRQRIILETKNQRRQVFNLRLLYTYQQNQIRLIHFASLWINIIYKCVLL